MKAPMHDFREEEKLGKVFDIRYIRRLMRYLAPYKGLVVLVVLLLLMITAIDLTTPLIIKHVINNHIKIVGEEEGDTSETSEEEKEEQRPDMTEEEIQSHTDSILKFGLFLLGLFALNGIITFVQMYSLVYAGQNMISDMRRDVFSKLQELPLSFFDTNPTGRIITRVTNDVNVINEAFSGVVVYLFKDFFIMIGILGVLIYIDPMLSIAVLAPIPLVIVTSMIFRIIHRKVYRWIREAVAKLNAFMHESFSGVKIIKMFTRERRTEEEFDDVNQNNFRANFRIQIVAGIFGPIIMILTNIPIAILIWYGGGRLLSGYINFGDFYLFLMFLRMFFRPIQDFSQKYVLMQSAMASGERLFRLLDEESNIRNVESPVKFGALKGELELRDVRFSYDGENEVIKGVSFKVEPNKTLALVGNTGSGKTTITNLICRFYDVNEGEVLIDGIDVRNYDKYELRGNISIVMQEPFLFSDTIGNNIRLADPDISEEEMIRASEMVGADEFVRELRSAYEEKLGERGTSLSVGQRQLLTFARALAFDRKILVLDEATANIDTRTEALIQKATDTLLKGRTAVVVAHRLSTIRNADNIIVLEDGAIAEQGTHDELIEKQGIYYRMYRLQFDSQGV